MGPADDRVERNVLDDAPVPHPKQLMLLRRFARQRPDVVVAIFGETSRHSEAGERATVWAGHRRKATALVGDQRIGDAEPEASCGILEEAGDLLSWKPMPRI